MALVTISDDDRHAFPVDADKFVASLFELLRLQGNQLAIDLMENAALEIAVSDYDNWNGGTYGWWLRVRVGMAAFAGLEEASKGQVEKTILDAGRRLFQEFENHGLSQVLFVPGFVEPPDAPFHMVRGFSTREAFFAAREIDFVRDIGSGGFAKVVLARRRRLDVSLAVKFFAPHPFNADSEERRDKARARLVREARLLAGIDHPGVVRLIDFSTVNGDPVLVLEYVDGVTLDAIRRRDGPLSLVAACGYMVQVLDALDACHQVGVVHRDVSPRNVIVDGAGRVVLIDFGLGFSEEFIAESRRLTTQPLGTPGYRAPELDHAPLLAAPSADVYGAAALAVFLLTGRAPQVGARVEVDGAPPVLLAALRDALVPDPARRLPSARALKAAFVAALEPVPVAALTVASQIISEVEAREFLGIRPSVELEGPAAELVREFMVAVARLGASSADRHVAVALLLSAANESLDALWKVRPANSRCDSEVLKSSFSRLTAILSGETRAPAAAVIERAFADAVQRGWLQEDSYDSWVPGMRSGTGMRDSFRATSLGRRWLASTLGFQPS